MVLNYYRIEHLPYYISSINLHSTFITIDNDCIVRYRFHQKFQMIYNCDVSVQTSFLEEIHFQQKYRRIMFDIKPLSFYEIHPDLLLFIFVLSPVKLFLYLCKFLENGYSSNISNSAIFIYLFIFRSFHMNRRRCEFTKFENIRATNCFR